MRWRLRRGDEGAGGLVQQDEQPAPPSPTSSSASAQEPGWTSLPPIAPTWAANTPLTAAPQPIRTPLTREPARRVHAIATPGDGAPEPGRVIGLAAVIPPQPVEPARPSADLPEYFREQPPLRHVTARPLTEHTPLMEATDDYVGEPLVAAPPPPPPPQTTFFPQRDAPRPDPAIEASTDAGARFREALANLGRSGLPEYVGSEDGFSPQRRPETSAPAAPSQPAQTRPAVPGGTGEQKMTHRRNSLAESRRLGLGAPLRSGQDAADEEPLTHPSAATPAAPAAPAGIAPPAPVPPAPPPVVEPPPAPTPPQAAPRSRHRASDSTDSSDDEDGGGDGGSDALQTREPLRPMPVVRPVTDGSARPTASTTPLVFRAALRPTAGAPGEDTITRTPERAVITRPPAELAQALRASHGVDVADVPVRRDPDAGTEARQRRARAFTRGGTVYLPDDAGATTERTARGLLAHELVHAAQQRRFGGSLPAEDTIEGRALEAEAVAAEHMYLSGGTELTPETPLVHAPPPVTATWVEERIVQHAPLDTLEAPPSLSPAIAPLRHEIEQVADHSARRVIAEWHPPTAPVPGAPVHVPGLNPPAPAGLGPAPTLPVRSGSTGTVSSPTKVQDEGEREQMYLDMLNAARDRNGEPTKDELDSSEREQMYDLWGAPGDGAGGGAGGSKAHDKPTTMHWEPGKGFVATGPGAEEATANMRNAWGGMAIGSLFAPKAADATPGTTTAGGTGGTQTPGTGGPQAPGTDGTQVPGDAGPSQQLSMADALGNLFGAHHRTEAEQHAQAGAATPGSGSTPAGTARTPAATTVSAAAATDAAHHAGDGPVDLDQVDMEELSIRIYARLRSRLRQELLVDRERAGLLTDYR